MLWAGDKKESTNSVLCISPFATILIWAKKQYAVLCLGFHMWTLTKVDLATPGGTAVRTLSKHWTKKK